MSRKLEQAIAAFEEKTPRGFEEITDEANSLMRQIMDARHADIDAVIEKYRRLSQRLAEVRQTKLDEFAASQLSADGGLVDMTSETPVDKDVKPVT